MKRFGSNRAEGSKKREWRKRKKLLLRRGRLLGLVIPSGSPVLAGNSPLRRGRGPAENES